ncbi:sigma-70 family RNA polymerase sigma factor [Sphingomonas suaedae]|uniref:Sigma-70 family RNA polymerase sigma factor n=1 Tax=Sphingomonas suaedae TaxID=2599297 RepID=A0A518RC18_9SPHN|nr:sigma-70 family RNA polymerase sigma factor [Sphingomonas suaedae]QDX25010.1 sigma-70 family RNA polymerase sigma factor [Sphingomonas suaedae]
MMTLVEPLIPSLRRYARSLLRDQSAADDLVQDCLERVIGRWHQRRADGNARTWVFTILHNLAINRMKQTARRGVHVTVDDMDEAAIAIAPAQEHRLHHRAVVDALSGLPEDQRSVLLLVSVEDLSYAETASILDIPIGTVMSRLSRARHRLAQILEERPDRLASTGTVLRRVK